ncbi:MAG: hypothetical protein U9N78_07900 [Actinomycetota bacterium]|nr:hypothetical protein [Actinomycetota bacterium]
MNVRFAENDDLPAIEEITRWACSEAIGEMVPEAVVDSEIQSRFRKSVLSEHLLARRLLVGVDSAGHIELVVMVNDQTDHIELITSVVPSRPNRSVDGLSLVDSLRFMGWLGPISSSVALGDTVHEHFYELAGFAPGDVTVDRVAGHDVFRREWWLDPVLSAAG